MEEAGITLRWTVIHELIKEQHTATAKEKLADQVLDSSAEAVAKLISAVVKLYGTKMNRAHYGTFRDDGREGRFPADFKQYSKLIEPTDGDFLALTKIVMDEMRKSAEKPTAATGGYLLFADCSSGSERFFLVVMIKQTDGLRLSDDMVPEELTHLDLKRLHQAAKIGFEKFARYKDADEEARPEMTYLSFVSPSTTKTATGYFIDALGCNPGTASSRATRTVLQKVPEYFRSQPALKHKSMAVREKLISVMNEKIETGKSITLHEIETIVRQFMPVEVSERAEELVDALLTELNSEEHAVPVEFPVHKATKNRFQRIKGETKQWAVDFDRSALGTGADADVRFLEAENKLVLKNVPEGMARMIMGELSGDEDEGTQ